jgi:hypothetical protein
MPPRRDNFTARQAATLAARAGSRCSNLTCRRVTSRPDPSSPEAAINIGTASHSRAASPGGPRFDPAMTPEERSSIENGIWLCAVCARIVDNAPDAYPVATLEAWKAHAERAAVRESDLPSNEARDLVANIESARDAVANFRSHWEARDPVFRSPPSTDDWDEHTRQILEYAARRRGAFDVDVAPLVADVLVRA